MKTQVCYKCKENLFLYLFHKDKSRKYGCSKICKNCKGLYKKKYRLFNIKRFRYREYFYSSKKRKNNFILSYEEFLKFWGGQCSYCGENIKTIGLDRIDNNIGYEISNIVKCCKDCNLFRGRIPQDKFINMCKKIGENCKL